MTERIDVMRDVLFRGRDIAGNWHYGDLEIYSDDVCKIVDHKVFEYGKIVIPETVGQYIGLTDKNGTKIFEGDIVVDKYDCEKFGFVGVVKYVSERTQYEIKSKNYPDYIVNIGSRIGSIKVIGNIHDNPELLKEG